MSSKTTAWRIAHTADTQLGFKQYGFQQRMDDYNLAVSYVFNQAIQNKVDVINVAGDIFQMPNPPGSCVANLHGLVGAATNAAIQVIGIEGNHDPADTPNSWLKACGITPLDVGTPTMVTLVDPQKGTLRIAGLNYYQTPTLLAKLKELAAYAVANGGVDVVVLHCSVAEMAGFRGVELTAAEIAHILSDTGCRLVLMGDIHDGKQLQVGNMLFSYSGSLEMTAANENPAKTFNIIEITTGATPDLKVILHPIPNRPVVSIHVRTEDDLQLLAAECERHKNNQPLLVVTYSKNVPNFQNRAKQLLEGKCMFRLLPTENPDAINYDILAQLSQQSFERKGALTNLKEVVTRDFGYPVDSDEFRLIMEMMEAPNNVDRLCEEYLRSCGLNLKPQGTV